MASQRLSKLQKFILCKGYEDLFIMDRHFKEFYGVCKGWKDGKYLRGGLSTSQRVTKFRCYKNLLDKKLVQIEDHFLVLTEDGFLKANDLAYAKTFVSFKEYRESVVSSIKEYYSFSFKKRQA